MPAAACALCGTIAPLINSHFLPAALYQEMNEPTGSIQNMIVVRKDATFQSGEQFVMPLLCQACEIRFQQGGEDWVLGMRYRSDGSFPLRDLLVSSNAVDSNTDSSVYEVSSVAGLDIAKICYFAASLFWRAGIANWSTRFANAPQISMKADLMTGFSDYLLGVGSFPAEAFLVVSVARESQPKRVLLPPHKAQDVPFNRYEAHIPGMMFELFVNADPKFSTFSISTPPGHIVLTDLICRRLTVLAISMIPNSELKGSLKKKLS
jgi:hypothetical protein